MIDYLCDYREYNPITGTKKRKLICRSPPKEDGTMGTQAQTQMATHALSRVYGQYVIVFDAAPVFADADIEVLFEQLENVSYKDAHKIRILLVSGEEWDSDDITALIWDAMVEHYAGTFPHETWDEWQEHVGFKIDWIEFGFEEFDLAAEYRRRAAEAEPHPLNKAGVVSLPIAAE